jgi:hypothetical protein
MPKHEEVLDALAARKDWEERQRTWVQMRHDGIRRRNKPWPNAADMHFPLGDIQVEKLKPHYIAQVYAQELAASFRATKPEYVSFANNAAQWFNDQLKEETNFEEEIAIAIDSMLEGAKSVVKVYWDPKKQQIQYDAVDRLHIIVPSWTEKVQDADWLVHVQHFSPAAYKLRKEFKQDADFIKCITGGTDEAAQAFSSDKYSREGITNPSKDQIIIWEEFSRDEDDSNKVIVRTYSPAKPDVEIRPRMRLPYDQGMFAKGALPFAEINAEVKGKGFYSPRGVVERVAPFEMSLCSDWNTQKDYQRLMCTPMFSVKQGSTIPDTQNLRMVPGQIMPFELQAVTFPQMPVDLQQQMIGTRMIAEQAIQTPDFGAAQQTNTTKARTATEMSMAGAQAGAGIDMRGRTFKRELGLLFKLTWALCIQYKKDSLSYFYLDELQQMDPKAMADQYRIEPSGSADNQNKQFRMQKAVARKQMFTSNPNINQVELDRSVLEEDDPRLVKKLLLDQGTQQAMQLEDQAQEISILLINFPAQVKPTDDDMIHLQAITGFLQRKQEKQEYISPEQVLFLGQHAQAHLAQWKKKNPPQFAQQGAQYGQFWGGVMQEAQQYLAQQQQMQAQAAAGGVQGAPGGNVVPMGGAR